MSAASAGSSTRNSSHSLRRVSRRHGHPAGLLLTGAFATVLCVGAVFADDGSDNGENGGAVRLLTTIPVPGNALRGFDISWLDASTQRYYLADRSNKAVDVVDARTRTFLKQIPGNFAGVKFNATTGAANNDISGPNGVVSAGRWLFVTDGGSRVVSIDLTTDQIADSVTTSASANRADEIAYDADDGVLLAVNNADSPPFATLISVNKGNGHLTVGARITFDMAHAGFDATNGAEQPVWDKDMGKFFLSIPEVNCTSGAECGGAGINGGVARISPHSTGGVEQLFPVKYCQPAGLTLGPKQNLLLGCSVVFDTAGSAWSASDPNTAAPLSLIMDAKTGNIVQMVKGVSGSDEVWFNAGDGRYYLAARNQPGGPVLGVIDAKSKTLVQVVPTINTPGKAFVFPAGTSHSLAANSNDNNVFVPLPANNVFPACLNGCIGVFAAPGERDENDDD
jgi:hypothetical protein